MTLLEAAEKALNALEFMRDDPDIIGWCLEADEAIIALHKALQTIDHDVVAAAAVRKTSAEYRLGWNDAVMMEREACAQLCQDHFMCDGDWCAKQIRAKE